MSGAPPEISPASGIRLANNAFITGLRDLRMGLRRFIEKDKHRRAALVEGYVYPESTRCVQCGICSYHCPISIDVRQHAWLGEPVMDSHCLTCGECVARCPRGVLRFEKTNLFAAGGKSSGTIIGGTLISPRHSRPGPGQRPPADQR